MNITENKPHASTLELTIDFDRAEIEGDLQKAAKHLAGHINVPGFRAGQAPYDVVSRHLGGEDKIYQEALEHIVRRFLPKVIKEKNLEFFGQPRIDILKAIPPFGISLKIIFALVPSVELGPIEKIKVEGKKVAVDDKEVAAVINDLRAMRAAEAAVERAAQNGDKIVIDYEIKKGGVPVENGMARHFALVLGEGRFIPGFEGQVLGLRRGEKKTFPLTWAGQPVDFSVTVNEVYERMVPEFNDEFAKNLGKFDSATALREQIKANMQTEKDQAEKERFEVAAMEELVKISKVGDLPAMMIDQEVKKMIHELEHSLNERAVKLVDYLQTIKKTRQELEAELRPQAEHRLRISLVGRAFAKEVKVAVSDDEVADEIEAATGAYVQQPEVIKQINSQEYRDYLRNVLTSRKTFEKLADKVRGGE